MVFEQREFDERMMRVRAAMEKDGVEILLVSDPCNIYYLTGYDGWSFYTPQILVVSLYEDPIWFGRQMDTLGVKMQTWLPNDRIVGHPDRLIQSADEHPFHSVGELLAREFGKARRVAVEKLSYYLTVQSYEEIVRGLNGSEILDGSLLINWVRFIKSPAEIDLMRQASRLLEASMAAAIDAAVPGARECDVAAAVYAANLTGTDEFGGVYTSSPAFVMSGPRTGAPHICWSDRKLESSTPMNLELMGNRLRYQVVMGRTVYFGDPPKALKDLEAIVLDGIDATLDFIRPGVTCEEVENKWRQTVAKFGLAKDSRCGYSIGIAYPPTGGELTASLRPGDTTVLEPGATMHFIPAIWESSQSLVISEPFVVTEDGCECLCEVPRQLITTH